MKTRKAGRKKPTRCSAAEPAPAHSEAQSTPCDPHLLQHIALSLREADTPQGRRRVAIDDAESPLGWLARRAGRDGRPMIDAEQFEAGERLRADFTRAQMMPRMTANWSAAGGGAPRGSSAETYSDLVMAARQRVNSALGAVGPEFSGLLLDVCCFVKGLEDVERERRWPPRSAKIVLQLALDRLARHYGYRAPVPRGHCEIRAWSDEGGAAPPR
jgi:hypothetical protein